MENKSNQYFLQQLVTLHGLHSYSQTKLSADMCEKVSRFELPEIDAKQGHLKRSALMALAATLSNPTTKSLTQMVQFLYEHSEINNRHFEISLDEQNSRRDWYNIINQATFSMGKRVLEKLFANGTNASDCDGLIVVSSTYSGFPSLGRQLQEKFKFPLEAVCYDLNASGCAGAPQGIYLANMLLQSGRCNSVCIVCVDAMGTYGQVGEFSAAPPISRIVANCLASDGAAAIVLSKKPGPNPILSYKNCNLSTRLWPESAHLNILSVDESNQPYVSVGKDIQTRLLGELEIMLNESMLNSPVFLHPGGIALMRLVREKYPQLAASTSISVAELEDTGNIGSPSVLLVFKKALDENATITPCFRLIAFGPGKFTAILLIDGVQKC